MQGGKCRSRHVSGICHYLGYLSVQDYYQGKVTLDKRYIVHTCIQPLLTRSRCILPRVQGHPKDKLRRYAGTEQETVGFCVICIGRCSCQIPWVDVFRGLIVAEKFEMTYLECFA